MTLLYIALIYLCLGGLMTLGAISKSDTRISVGIALFAIITWPVFAVLGLYIALKRNVK